MSYELQSRFGLADIYIRRIVLRPPETEFTVYCHSELAIARSYNESSVVTSVIVDGTHPAIMKTSRVFRIPELGRTSTVRVAVTQECIGFVRVCIPANEPFEAEGYHHVHTHNVVFYRSPEELVEYARSLQHVRFENAYWLGRIRDHLHDLKSVHVCFSHHQPVDWADVRDVIQRMRNLESLRISHHTGVPFVFELFPNTPGTLRLDGMMEVVGLEHFVTVRDLYLNSYSSGGFNGLKIPPEIVRFLPNLERLSLTNTDLSFPLLALGMSELVLHSMDLTFEDLMTVGRLLRQNKLRTLEITKCPHVSKHGWRQILMPLMDGSNTSLVELTLMDNDLSTHVYYMLEDIVRSCRTLTSVCVPSCSFFDASAWDREYYFNMLGNVNYASKRLLDGCLLSRALTITLQTFALFRPVYRRKNRRWRRCGVREVVCSPFELKFAC